MKFTKLFFIAIALVSSGYAVSNASLFSLDKPELSKDAKDSLKVFGEAYAKIRREYVTEVEDKKLVEAAINGILTSLDPHSSYMDEKSFEELKQSTKGEFGGLGIEVTMENGAVKVISPIEGTPAEKAGIEAGDKIVAIFSKPIFGLTLIEAVEKMRGKPGTSIKITVVKHNKPEPVEYEIKREIIKVKATRSKLFGDVAYIKLNSFTEKAHESLIREYEKLKAEATSESKAELSGLILDLRNNPGGLLDQAIMIVDSFIDSGTIVSTKGRNPDNINKFEASSGDVTNGLPIVILINSGSASASEIVAGALQDHKRAIIVGTKSFGKGSVQSIIPMSNGGAIKMTTARYYTPKDRSIQANGITPDIIVEQAKIEKIDAPKISINESSLNKHLKNEAIDEEIEAMSSAPKNNEFYEKDFQLARAIDIVKTFSIIKNIKGAKNAK
ncbi:MAG: S41 family peptidase [Alphaproteobacteria bacterium]|nr:S41 family peptidase [Alphaproteobacteria bacterium]OJV14218.1 MAG: hypothetical protein BGO27_01810 [Alphaproteobacteria bacterium 33-17]